MKFFGFPVAPDARVNANLRICLDCETPLVVQLAGHGARFILFAQCQQCAKVYVLQEGNVTP